jgi:NADH-quinone oxidoreductase subunit L
MTWIVHTLWLIPVLPVLAAGIIALLPQPRRTLAQTLAISAMSASLVLSLVAFFHVLARVQQGALALETVNFRWLQMGDLWLRLGWMLDPLTALMLVMVSLVSLLVFLFSTGYMEHDENATRFFCFLALFAGAMLGVVIANSLLLLFMGWELVGVTSYLLIGFWYAKPSAAAAAKKAFIVTRIGDLGFLLGMVWLYGRAGTLLLYDNGAGCMEHAALARLSVAAATGCALLLFCGAAGKSGQLPLHVWLPDAMEGPTPVSALIHAATMVAAGVFLVARVYPLMSLHPGAALAAGAGALQSTPALRVITWVGAGTALFAAAIAVAQNDIKRILAYSTVSQLGYMMLGLGVGGVVVGIFHLLTHAFFKSLLFLGAGSVIHGCNGEQDIRRMGGLGKAMPITFAAYAAGMLALCGFPLFFSGFWSKDAILHAAHLWSASQIPYWMASVGALLTAFYMTRQVCYVFAGSYRGALGKEAAHGSSHAAHAEHGADPHESPAVITLPLVVLAIFAIALGWLGTPAWEWMQAFLQGKTAAVHWAAFADGGLLTTMAVSSVLVFLGLGLGWQIYGRSPAQNADTPDALEQKWPRVFTALGAGLYVDALYAATVMRLYAAACALSDWLDRRIWSGAVRAVSGGTQWMARAELWTDAHVVNAGFDSGCQGITRGGQALALLQNGRVQRYLRVLALALFVLVAALLWRMRG